MNGTIGFCTRPLTQGTDFSDFELWTLAQNAFTWEDYSSCFFADTWDHHRSQDIGAATVAEVPRLHFPCGDDAMATPGDVVRATRVRLFFQEAYAIRFVATIVLHALCSLKFGL